MNCFVKKECAATGKRSFEEACAPTAMYNSTFAEIKSMAEEVYALLNKGCSEHHYALAFGIEARARGYIVELEVPFAIMYKNESAGFVRVDLIISKGSERVIVEVKAVAKLTETHTNQAKNYVLLAKHSYGVLINFSQKPGAALPEVQLITP